MVCIERRYIACQSEGTMNCSQVRPHLSTMNAWVFGGETLFQKEPKREASMENIPIQTRTYVKGRLPKESKSS